MKTFLDREEYNYFVWNLLLHRKKVNHKSRKFKFHHEITTDGVAASLLFSQESPYGMEKASTRDVDCGAPPPH